MACSDVSSTGWTGPLVKLHQLPQTSASALGDLAVLLRRPARDAAKLGTRHVARQLRSQDHALIGAELADKPAYAPKLLARDRLALHIRAAVHDLETNLLWPFEGDGVLQRGLHRAASRERPAAVVHARDKSLLEHVSEMRAAVKTAATPDVNEQLECGLPIAVLEVLPAQPMAVNAQQELAPCARHKRELLTRIEPPSRAAVALPSYSLLVSGRHTEMSIPGARTPPSQSPGGGRAGHRRGEANTTREMSVTDRLHRLDRWQQRRPAVSFVAAVIKKFGEDQAGQLAALIAYYAFVSLFPLLLVFVTVLGYILQNNPQERDTILNGTLGQFPIIGDQLKVHSISGSGLALAVGIIVSLLAGLGIMGASQAAFNRIWHVPFKRRPDFIHQRLRSLMMLVILATLAIASTAAAGFVGSTSHPALTVVAGVLIAFAFNLALFMLAFKVLTAAELGWRDLWLGVLVASVFWQLLQHLGGFYLDHVLKRTQPLYGIFALVLGLLAWLYLGAQLTIFAAEVNVVHRRRLWPRSFFQDPLLEADRRALTSSAEIEERIEEESVDVSFEEPSA